MENETEVGVSFPTSGVDVTCEYGRQPAATAPEAANVRGFDTFANRLRGGSRPGLTKWINDQVEGLSVVQHLTILVDPTLEGLTADDDGPTGTVPDPTTGPRNTWGRRVRDGGSGRQPSRNKADRKPNITFIQKKRLQPGNVTSGNSFTVTLDTQPNVNDLVVVVVRTENFIPPGTAVALVGAVTEGSSQTFTRIGGSGYTSDVTTNIGGGDDTVSLSMWYRVANTGVPSKDVVITSGDTAVYEACVLVYRGAATAGPLSNNERAADVSNTTSWTVGPLALNNTNGQLVVAAYSKFNTTVSPQAAYTARFGMPGVTAANTAVMDRLELSGATPENPTATSLIARAFCGIAAAFTK